VRFFSILVFTATVCVAASNPEIFRQRIQPILTQKCASCHSVNEPAGGLSVADFDSVLEGGKHGPAIVPGNSADSLLIQYLRGQKTPKMPMGAAPLPESIIANLAAAIDEMAPAAQARGHRRRSIIRAIFRPVE
jgi:hypothetical protein